jgi:molybdopterin synthase catalytic subunit
MTANVTIRIQQADFDIGREISALTQGRTAMSRWPLTGVTVIHRVGRIKPGENIVLVLTASQHRQAAFQAAEFLMDYLKANAPFWKREEKPTGTSWVDASHRDDDAAARWTKS